jgi:hypothetical protein
MTGGRSSAPLRLFHELAERLQTTSTYLAAIRRHSQGGALGTASTADVIEKAHSEMERAQEAFRKLREHLFNDEVLIDGPADETRRPAAFEGD